MDRDSNGNQGSDWFWNIIAMCQKDRARLKEMLSTLSSEELQGFDDEFMQLAADLKDDPFLQYIAPDESEDGIDDITRWVVSQGREYYQEIWSHPEKIPPHFDPGDDRILSGVADAVHYERFGRGLP
jgi:hypothetical protein